MSEQQFPFGDFTRVWVESALSIEIRRSDSFSVTTDGENFNHIRVEKSGDILKIRRRGLDFHAIFRPRPHIIVNMPRLNELVLSGACQAKASGFGAEGELVVKLSGASHLEISSISSDSVKIEVNGASNVTGDVRVNANTMFNINGASRVELSGLSTSAKLELSGASQARLANFNLNNIDATISGASSAQLKVSGKLDVNLSGASRLEYGGSPTLGNVAVSGASSLKRR